MRRTTSTAVAAATAAAFLVSGYGPAHAQTTMPERTHSLRSAGIALEATGYGTRLAGGQVPAGSGQTAFTALSCQTRVGVRHENHEAQVTLPGGAGTVSGIRTDLWTTRRNGGVHTFSRNRTANVVLAQSGLGTLRLTAVSSLSHAWHNASGFHAKTRVDLGELEFVPPTGAPQSFPLPTPGQPVTVPGLATIAVGQTTRDVSAAGATARANALRVTVLPTHTRLTVGHSSARALAGVKYGTFHGSSAGSEVTAAGDAVTSGRTPLSLMPCQGTRGKTATKAIADVNLGDQVVVQGLRSQQSAAQRSGRSVAMERGTVAGIDLGDGELVIDAIRGQANVTRTAAGKVTSSTRGTSLGTVTVNGQVQRFPHTDTIEIPHLAKLQRHVVKRTRFGISVVALRITLLDGTGAVIDLGVAKAGIH